MYWFAGQFRQLVIEVLPVWELKVPDEQGTGLMVDGKGQKEPPGQVRQVAEEEAPAVREKEPAGQARQVAFETAPVVEE